MLSWVYPFINKRNYIFGDHFWGVEMKELFLCTCRCRSMTTAWARWRDWGRCPAFQTSSRGQLTTVPLTELSPKYTLFYRLKCGLNERKYAIFFDFQMNSLLLLEFSVLCFVFYSYWQQFRNAIYGSVPTREHTVPIFFRCAVLSLLLFIKKNSYSNSFRLSLCDFSFLVDFFWQQS